MGGTYAYQGVRNISFVENFAKVLNDPKAHALSSHISVK